MVLSVGFVILFDCDSEYVHSPFKVFLLEDVSNTYFVKTAAGSCIEAFAGSEHYRIAVIVEIGEQPLLEGVGIVDGESCHHVECTLGSGSDDAGDLHELCIAGIPAALIFLADCFEILGTDGIERSGCDLIESCNGKPCLAELQKLLLEKLVAGDDGADTRAAGGEALGNGINDDSIFVDIFECADGRELLTAVNKLTVYLIADNVEVMLLCKICNNAELFGSEDDDGGAARIGEQYSTGLIVYKSFELLTDGITIALLG